jgi:hypothetical protein
MQGPTVEQLISQFGEPLAAVLLIGVGLFATITPGAMSRHLTSGWPASSRHAQTTNSPSGKAAIRFVGIACLVFGAIIAAALIS